MIFNFLHFNFNVIKNLTILISMQTQPLWQKSAVETERKKVYVVVHEDNLPNAV